jgi:hypothetical protein
MESGVSVIFEKAQHVVAPVNWYRPPVHRVQDQNVTRLRDSDNQGLALATSWSRAKRVPWQRMKIPHGLCASTRTTPCSGKTAACFILLNASMDSWERSQKQLRERRWQLRQLSTQFDPDTLIGAPPSPTKTRLRRFWRETIDQQQIFKSRISSDCPLRQMMTGRFARRLRSILGLKLNACSIHPVRSGQD